MTTPATPSAPKSAGDDRNLVAVDEHYVALTFEDRLRIFWQKNGKSVIALVVIVLLAILAKGADPVERRRGLPGDPDDAHSRYIEAEVNGIVIGCLYLPNGNPQPGPKFDYKLKWFDRLIAHSAELLKEGKPTVLLGDYNVIPTDEVADIYSPASWKKDALTQPESRAAYFRMLDQGWTDAIRTLHPTAPMYTFWDYMRQRWQRNAGFRIDHLLLTPDLAKRLKAAEVDRDARGKEKASDHAPVWVQLG